MVKTDEYGYYTRSVRVADLPYGTKIWIVTRWQNVHGTHYCWDARIEINFRELPLLPFIKALNSLGDCSIHCLTISGEFFKPYSKLIISPPLPLQFEPILERLKWVEKATETILSKWRGGHRLYRAYEYNWKPKLCRIIAEIVTQKLER